MCVGSFNSGTTELKLWNSVGIMPQGNRLCHLSRLSFIYIYMHKKNAAINTCQSLFSTNRATKVISLPQKFVGTVKMWKRCTIYLIIFATGWSAQWNTKAHIVSALWHFSFTLLNWTDTKSHSAVSKRWHLRHSCRLRRLRVVCPTHHKKNGLWANMSNNQKAGKRATWNGTVRAFEMGYALYMLTDIIDY